MHPSLPIRSLLGMALLATLPFSLAFSAPLLHLTGALTMSADTAAPQAILTMLEGMRAAIGDLTDASYTLHQHEWKNGKWLPRQELFVKFRPPHDLYLRWVGSTNKGREVLYRGPGWNRGRLRVNAGRFIPTIDLDPLGSTAMAGSRQPVWMAGLSGIVGRILSENDKLVASSTMNATYHDLGQTMVHGIRSYCYEAELPKDLDPSLYARKVLVCIGLQTHLPTRFRSWDYEDGAFRLLEEYDYMDMRLNIGLTDSDFDPNNSEYGF